MKHKKPKKKHKQGKMVPYWQAIFLVVLMFVSQALCGFFIYSILFPPHFKTDKTYISAFEIDCVVYREGTYCCNEPWAKTTNLSNPDFGWIEESECIKYKKVP